MKEKQNYLNAAKYVLYSKMMGEMLQWYIYYVDICYNSDLQDCQGTLKHTDFSTIFTTIHKYHILKTFCTEPVFSSLSLSFKHLGRTPDPFLSDLHCPADSVPSVTSHQEKKLRHTASGSLCQTDERYRVHLCPHKRAPWHTEAQLCQKWKETQGDGQTFNPLYCSSDCSSDLCIIKEIFHKSCDIPVG